jgi:hypothetical protein
MDTHRVWETLLVGAIPALLASDHSARLLRELNLPHIALTSWEELRDYPAITARYLDCIKESWDFSGLSASSWISRIEANIRYPGLMVFSLPFFLWLGMIHLRTAR